MQEKTIKIGFLGSPYFAAEILEYVHFFGKMKDANLAENKKDDISTNEFNGFSGIGNKVVVTHVFTNVAKKAGRGNKIVPTAVAEKAKQLNLNLLEVAHFPKTLPSHILINSSESSEELIKDAIVNSKNGMLEKILLAIENIDVMLVVSFGQILPEWFFNKAKLAAVNLHFSLLPTLRGASPIEGAVLSGKEKSGVTLQRIAKKLDSGDVLLQEKVAIKGMNKNEIIESCLPVCKRLLQNFFLNSQKILAEAKPQQEEKATYCYKIKKDDGCINARMSPQGVYRKFLAYSGWPNIFFFLNGKRIEILEMEIYEDTYLLTQVVPMGSVFVYDGGEEKKSNTLLLGLFDGCIVLKKLKVAGKNAVFANDFINGFSRILPATIEQI